MGRGSSKASGGSAGSKAATNKPFNANDWKTWPVGTKIAFNDEGDFVDSEDDSGRVAMTSSALHSGTVVQVFPDHLIVDVPDISGNMWLDGDTADLFRVRRG